MSTQSLLRLSLTAAFGLALIGSAGAALAQNAPPSADNPPPAADMTPTPNTQQAVYHTKQGTLIIKSTVPEQPHYGPAPDFARLDANHNGRLSADEANAYAPLANDFLYVSHGAKTISRSQYKRWVQGRSTTT